MERDADVVIDTKVDLSESQDRVYAPELDAQSVMQSEVMPPWADSYDISADSEGELQSFLQRFSSSKPPGIDRQLDDEVREDKHRRIRHDLEPGDIIEAVNSVARISGVDSFRAFLWLCHSNRDSNIFISWSSDSRAYTSLYV